MPPPRGRFGSRLVTLSTDVGTAYAAQMKAVLVRSLDASRIVDLVHDLPRHGIAEAAFVVRATAGGFPRGTVHVVVVDPGVGGIRAPIVLRCRDGSTLVGPDNGVLLPLAEHLGGVAASFRIDPDRRGANRRVGTTFDGRDVFAPAAALLARGIPASRLGRPIDPIVYRVPDAVRISGGARGKIVHVDRFGNLITNVPSEWVLPRAGQLRLTVGRRSRIVPWVRSYEALGPRRVGALGSSFGTLEVAVREGSAAVRLAARTGTRVSVVWAPGARRATEMVNSVRPRSA